MRARAVRGRRRARGGGGLKGGRDGEGRTRASQQAAKQRPGAKPDKKSAVASAKLADVQRRSLRAQWEEARQYLAEHETSLGRLFAEFASRDLFAVSGSPAGAQRQSSSAGVASAMCMHETDWLALLRARGVIPKLIPRRAGVAALIHFAQLRGQTEKDADTLARGMSVSARDQAFFLTFSAFPDALILLARTCSAKNAMCSCLRSVACAGCGPPRRAPTSPASVPPQRLCGAAADAVEPIWSAVPRRGRGFCAAQLRTCASASVPRCGAGAARRRSLCHRPLAVPPTHVLRGGAVHHRAGQPLTLRSAPQGFTVRLAVSLPVDPSPAAVGQRRIRSSAPPQGRDRRPSRPGHRGDVHNGGACAGTGVSRAMGDGRRVVPPVGHCSVLLHTRLLSNDVRNTKTQLTAVCTAASAGAADPFPLFLLSFPCFLAGTSRRRSSIG